MAMKIIPDDTMIVSIDTINGDTLKITPHKGGADGRREKRFPSARMTQKEYDYFVSLGMSGGDFIHWAILAHKKQNEETKRKIEKFVI